MLESAARWLSYVFVLILVGCGGRDGGSSAPGSGGNGAPGGAFGGPGGGSGTFGPGGGSGTFGPGGSSGVDPCIVTPFPTNCGGGLCGNGVRDTCLIRAAFDDCPEVRFTEVCDGSDSGAQACQDLGYGGGTPTCSNFCQTIDESGCTECRATDAWLLYCGDAPLTRPAVEAVIAATDSEVALAWLHLDSNATPTLNFARLTPNLGVISSASISDAWVANAWGLQVAPLPSGWVVTGYADPELFIQAFDAAGQPVKRTIVDSVPNGTLNITPLLASRALCGPLMFCGDAGVVRAALVAADGRSSSTPIGLTTEAFFIGFPSAAYVGDAFYVAYARETLVDEAHLRLVRVEVDGRITAPFDALPAETVYDPSLVTGADDLRVVYPGRFGAPNPDPEIWSMLWQRMHAAGGAASAPAVLSAEPDLSMWGRGVAFGPDTVVLLRTFDQPGWMGLARVASDGNLVMPLRKIAMGAEQGFSRGHGLVRRGPDAVVLWMSEQGRIRLARVAM